MCEGFWCQWVVKVVNLPPSIVKTKARILLASETAAEKADVKDGGTLIPDGADMVWIRDKVEVKSKDGEMTFLAFDSRELTSISSSP